MYEGQDRVDFSSGRWWVGPGWYELSWDDGYEEALWGDSRKDVARVVASYGTELPAYVSYSGDGELPDPMSRIAEASLPRLSASAHAEYDRWFARRADDL